MIYAVALSIVLLLNPAAAQQPPPGQQLLSAADYQSLLPADQQLLDSLVSGLSTPLNDSIKLGMLAELSEICEEADIPKFVMPAQKIADRLILKSRESGNQSSMKHTLSLKGKTLNNIGFYHWQVSGNMHQALEFFKLSLKFRQQAQDKAGQAESLNNIAELYRVQGNINKALDAFRESMKIREEINDVEGIIVGLNNISLIYVQQAEYDLALENYFKAKEMADASNDITNAAHILHNIGYLYQTMGDTSKVIEYELKSLELFKKLNYLSGIALIYNDLGAYYQKAGQSNKAMEYYKMSYEHWRKAGNKADAIITLVNIGNIHNAKNNLDSALTYGLQSLEFAKASGSPDNIKRASQLLYDVYKKKGVYEKALEMHELILVMSDSLLNLETRKATYRQQVKYEFDKAEAVQRAEHASELALAEESKKIRSIIAYTAVGGALLLFIFLAFSIQRLKITREQKLIIENQKKHAEDRNQYISDSIDYAKRIQDSILPSIKELKQYFTDHFILFKPKDVVSGDFYWFSVLPGKPDQAILVVADCTGHGVPGALMSMIGHTLLNEIIIEKNIHSPSRILEQLHTGVTNALHLESGNQKDGMDAGVLYIDKRSGSIKFSGAKHSLLYIQNDKIIELKGSGFSVGYSPLGTLPEFIELDLNPYPSGFMYLCSDGFQDQTSDNQKGRFLKRNLRELLQAHSQKPGKEQKNVLENEFKNWKGSKTQLDDVLVMGVKLG